MPWLFWIELINFRLWSIISSLFNSIQFNSEMKLLNRIDFQKQFVIELAASNWCMTLNRQRLDLIQEIESTSKIPLIQESFDFWKIFQCNHPCLVLIYHSRSRKSLNKKKHPWSVFSDSQLLMGLKIRRTDWDRK